MIESIAAAIAAVVIAALAYSFGVRFLAYRTAQLTEASRMDKLEAELAAHKDTHAKAIANLVTEMRTEVAAVKTKASLALDKANGKHRGYRPAG